MPKAMEGRTTGTETDAPFHAGMLDQPPDAATIEQYRENLRRLGWPEADVVRAYPA